MRKGAERYGARGTALKRIMKRDGITPEQAAQRMNAQYSEEFFKENSDFTVINDGRDIISQLKLFKEELL